MDFKINAIQESEYPEVVEVWEASVRATHHFLRPGDIEFFKPLILKEYLKMVELKAARDSENKIIGFLGVAGRSIEMLFIHPDYRGQGIGKALLRFACEKYNTNLVDVNEQNEQAVGFYEHYGFKIVGRSPLDGLGKPYPILHMELR